MTEQLGISENEHLFHGICNLFQQITDSPSQAYNHGTQTVKPTDTVTEKSHRFLYLASGLQV